MTAAATFRRHRWWLTRLVALPVNLLVFATIVFFPIRLMPGDPVLNITGGAATPAEVRQIRGQLGLDGSLGSQYWKYLSGLVRGNLGQSFTSHHGVADDIGALFPATLELAVLASVALAVFSICVATLIVFWPHTLLARLGRAYSQASGAVPDFVLGVFGILIFYSTFHWIPAPTGLLDPSFNTPRAITHFPLADALLTGYWNVVLSEVAHLILPIAVLVLAAAPLLIRQLVSAMEHTIDSPPIRFRIATGASRRSVLASLYRGSLPPAVTLFGTVFGALLGGAVIIEQLFGIPGIGGYAVSAVGANDYPALQGVLLVAAATSLIVFLLVDVATMLLDPRRKPGASTEA